MHASVKSNLAFFLKNCFSHQVSQEKKTRGFTKMGMPAGAELSVFEKPSEFFTLCKVLSRE
jgi:hypothetical protein